MVWVVSQTHAHIFQPLDEYKAILRKLIKVRQLLMDLKRPFPMRSSGHYFSTITICKIMILV
jgi:hypothetical protein